MSRSSILSVFFDCASAVLVVYPLFSRQTHKVRVNRRKAKKICHDRVNTAKRE